MPLRNWSLRYRHRVLLIFALLALFGLVMIYSASYYSAGLEFGDPFYYVKKQGIALVASIVFVIIGATTKPQYIFKWRYAILVLSILLLALVFVPSLGVDAYGATRWLNLGFMTIQPSEFAKFGLMFFLAGEMAQHPPTTLKRLIIPILAILAICGLIIIEPNMSITMTVAMASMVLLFVGGLSTKYIIALGAVALVAVPVMIIIEPYRMQRLVAFLDPWANPKAEGYQLIQSYFALSNGGLFGEGLFNSRQKYLFLPFAESDFIFAIIGEELGFVGSLVVIAFYFLVIYFGIKIAKNAMTCGEMLLATGVVAIIAVQTLLNIAVVSGTIPPTGVPLPFISAGGSSLMAFSLGIGVLYRVDYNTHKKTSFHTI